MNRLLLSVFLALFLLTGAGCAESPETIWQIPIAEFQGRLAGETSEFLLHIAYDEADLDDIERLGPGGYFGVATHLRRLGAEERALNLYREALRREPEPWRTWALLESAELLAAAGEYRDVVELLEEEPSSLRVPALTFRYGEALYELNRYRALLDLLENSGTLYGEGEHLFYSEELAEERLIWRSVSSHQTGEIVAAIDAAEELFVAAPLSARQNRLLLYLDYYDLLNELDPEIYSIARGRIALLDRRWGQAAESFSSLPPELMTPEVLYDAFRAFRGARYHTRGAAFFLDALERAPAALHDRLGYYAGVFLRMTGENGRAAEVLRIGLEAQGDFPEHLLRQQFLRAAAASGDLPGALEFVLVTQGGQELSASLEETLYALVVGSWPLPERFAQELFELGEAGRGAQAAVLGSQGLLPASAGQLEALEAAQRQRSDLFYRFLAYAILPPQRRVSPERLLLLEEDPAGPAAEQRSPAAEQRSPAAEPARLPQPLSEEFYRRLLELGLYEEAYEIGLEYGSQFPTELLDEAGRGLQQVGRYYEALRVLHRAGYPRRLGTRERAELFYPRAYDPLMVSAARRENLDQAFWFSVVREESFFSSSVSSHVGAVGLSQLMPATAADISSRMGLLDPDLQDPETNIAIGSRYLRMLLDRFELPLPALAAYNAGQGRVRRWIVRNPRDMTAFHETIPFQETRNHVRKVLVSSVYYNYLYFDIPVEETVRRFFPSLREYAL